MKYYRPQSEEELEAILRSIRELGGKKNFEDALAICERLIEEKETEVAGYRERAFVKERMADLTGAIEDIKVVTTRFPYEPADFHALGILLLANEDAFGAVEAFGKSIALEADAGGSYYTNSSFLFRAEANLLMENFEDAIADSEILPAGYQTYISGTGMRSKESISSEAKAALEQK